MWLKLVKQIIVLNFTLITPVYCNDTLICKFFTIYVSLACACNSGIRPGFYAWIQANMPDEYMIRC